jgi:ribonuclease HII
MQKEINLSDYNQEYVIGVDEVGTGAWAGHIYVCAVKTRKDWIFPGLKDSKDLTAKERLELIEQVKNETYSFSIKYMEANLLDGYYKQGKNLGNALRDLYTYAILDLEYKDSLIIIDGLHKLEKIKHISLAKADSIVPAVMLASVLAKVSRDQRMVQLSHHYPVYDFASNKGYRSPKHIEALEKYGPSAIHRFSYKPVQQYLEMRNAKIQSG